MNFIGSASRGTDYPAGSMQMQSLGYGVPADRRTSAAADVLAPPAWELLSLILLVVCYVLVDGLFGADSYETLNVFGPLALAAVLAAGAAHMARVDVKAVWTAIFWFRIATGLYFGLGSTMPYFVNTKSLLYMQVFYDPSAEEIFTLNLIVALSTLTVLASSRIAAKIWKQGRYRATLSFDSNVLPIAGLAFAVIGVTVKYFILLPITLNDTGGDPIPGVIQSMGLLPPVALYMLTVWSLRHRPMLLPVMVAFLALQILTGLIEFNKSEIIQPVLLFFLAFLSRRTSIPRLVVSVACVAFVFTTVVPVVDYGRGVLLQRYRSLSRGSLGERFDILKDHFSGDVIAAGGDDIQGSLVRISYVNVATFAIANYNAGKPGFSLDNGLVVIIPRILWPNKPNVTDVGFEFNALSTENSESSASPGLMAEAYWDLGWFGIPILMVPLGVILLLFGRYAMWILNTGRWGYFPLVLFVMRTGLRVDGFFTIDVIGSVAVLAVLHTVAHGVERLWAALDMKRALS
jgi:hypothetical protein